MTPDDYIRIGHLWGVSIGNLRGAIFKYTNYREYEYWYLALSCNLSFFASGLNRYCFRQKLDA